MTCRCRDTDTRRCRTESFHTGYYEWEQHQQVRVDRKRTNESLHRYMEDGPDVYEFEEALVVFQNTSGLWEFLEPSDVYQPDLYDEPLWWGESYGLYDHGCMCRRCLLHDDPGGCLNVEQRA